MEEQKGAI